MSQVSSDEFGGCDASVKEVLQVLEMAKQSVVPRQRLRADGVIARSEQTVVGAGAEQRRAQPVLGDPVAIGPWLALDESVEAQAAQLVAGPARGHGAEGKPQHGSEPLPKFAVGKSPGEKREQDQYAEYPLHDGIGEAERRTALGSHLEWSVHAPEAVLVHRAVLAGSFYVQETSVGGEAYLPQGGQVVQPFADGGVPGVVDGGLGAECAALVVVLLDAGPFVAHVQRGDYPVGEHPGAKPTRGLLGHPAPENQLHPVRTSQVQILADHFLEEDPPGQRSVEHLGQGELDLQDGQVIVVAGSPVLLTEGVRENRQPLAEQGVDVLGREVVADSLGAFGVRAGQEPVIQRFEGHALLSELAFEVFMAVDAQL